MANSLPSPLLQLENVGKTYTLGEVSVEVLKNINLEVYENEVLALVGPSGSGKSTILNIMGGLDTPSTGRVYYRGEDLSQFTASQLTRFRRDTVGFVFQFYNLVPTLTAEENVMVSTEISPDPLDVNEMLDLVGLSDRAGHFPSQLSGGEQQRVAIARALAKNPSMLFCDEPTGALDYATGIKVLRLLVDVRNQMGKTVLIITHNAAIAQAADRIIHLSSGQVQEVIKNDHPTPPEEISW